MSEICLAERREGLCERCEREYRPWVAASPLWNAVVRGGCINGNEEYAFLCANCFIEIADDRAIAAEFYIDAKMLVKAQTVTPSGRVWNDKTRRFEQRPRVTVGTAQRRTVQRTRP